jgi:hypothetical protein
VDVTVPVIAVCCPNAVPLNVIASSNPIAAARQPVRLFKNEVPPDRSFSMSNPPGNIMSTPPNGTPAFSPLGAFHRLQTLNGDQLAIRQEPNVVGVDGIPESLRRESIEFALPILAHFGEAAIRIHIE